MNELLGNREGRNTLDPAGIFELDTTVIITTQRLIYIVNAHFT
jgi:hypothetical protein